MLGGVRRLWGLAGGLVDGLLDVAFPPRCVACGELLHGAGEAFCFPCGETLVPAPAGAPAAWAYGGQLAVALERLKYGRQDWIARPLGRLWRGAVAAAARADLGAYDAVVPVPLHPARQARRGFNQAALLAAALARPVAARALRRVRDTRPQVGLSRADRAANVAGAFRATGAAAALAGRRVLVVDDVFTTGATLGECIAALRTAGAAAADVLALAVAE
jgi:ComF family protein